MIRLLPFAPAVGRGFSFLRDFWLGALFPKVTGAKIPLGRFGPSSRIPSFDGAEAGAACIHTYKPQNGPGRAPGWDANPLWGGHMQEQTPGSSTNTANKTTAKESDRTVWIYTGFVAVALALLGVLAYHFSHQLLK